MYAVINSGGKQYRLSEGDVVDLERLDGKIGDEVVLDQVLMVEGGDSPLIGTPTVDGARVVGTIVEQGKGDKIVVFKFKRRKMYRRRTGHRQLLTTVKIDSIESPGKATPAKKKAAAPVEKKEVEKQAEAPAEAKAPAKKAAKKAEKVEKDSKKTEKAAGSAKKAKPAESNAKKDKASEPASAKAAPKKTAKKPAAASKAAKPSAGKKAAASKAKSAKTEAKSDTKKSDSAKETE